MAESLLLYAVEGILTKVTSLAATEFSLVLGFKGDLAELRKSFVDIQAMLDDVHAHVPGEAMRIWVKDLKDTANKADDVLDDIAYEDLRRQVLAHDITEKVANFFSCNNPIIFHIKMAHKIKNIKTSLAKLNDRAAGSLGLVARTIANTASQEIEVLDRETVSIFNCDSEKFVVGRKGTVSDLVKTLTKSNYSDDLPVLAVVGMPGLGKTTLAKTIFHDPAIGVHFDKSIWVCVSTTFDVNKILRAILESLQPGTPASNIKEANWQGLRKELKEKRYLLVLDDVWNEDKEKWNELKSFLFTVCGNNGSRVIVTTRNQKVAEIMETLPRCNLGKLTDEECWLILKNKAIGSGSLSQDEETIGKEIAKKCGGLPLSAKVLGDVMRSKTSEQWQSIVKSKIWDSPEAEKRLISILELSFHDLKGSSLKQCFAYCSMLIEDSDIEKDDLVQLWMAQGCLHPCPDKKLDMEEMGDKYFNILLARSFFQNGEKDYGTTVTKYKMHDLVRDLAIHVSKSDNSRSLFSNGEGLESDLVSFRSLRVLNLYMADIETLPYSVGELKHLRYLNVLRTKVKAFPSSIGKLCNLQTLKIPSQIEELPKEMTNLVNLRHVYFGRQMKIPAGVLGRLTNLRSIPFLKVVDKEMSPKIEELGSLDQLRGTLSISGLENVRGGSESRKANLVEKKHIRKLILRWSHSKPDNNVTRDKDVLEGSNNNVSSDENVQEGPDNDVSNDEDVLDGLFKPKEDVAEGDLPHFGLEFLEIHGFSGLKFPSRLLLLNNLMGIQLVDCDKCERLPALGHLPNLRHVEIKNMKKLTCIGPEFYCDDGAGTKGKETRVTRRFSFPALKTLIIMKAVDLIEWRKAPTDKDIPVFPCLEELTIHKCHKLVSAPNHFPSLKKLKVIWAHSAGKAVESILSDQLTTLTDLEIGSVRGLTFLPEGVLKKNKNLARLHLFSCTDLIYVVPPHGSAYSCSSLQSLAITRCSKLKSLPDGILTNSLKRLLLGDCVSLESIPNINSDGDSKVTSLETLDVVRCSKIRSIPVSHGDGGGLPSLRHLRIAKCPKLLVPSGVLDSCPSLEYLQIAKCPKVTSLLTDSSFRSALHRLSVSHPDSFPLGGFTSLPHLVILYCKSKEIRLELSASLQELTIRSCHNLETIPSLEKLTRLRSLSIENCKRLKCLPSGLAAATSSSPVSCSSSLTSLKNLSIGPFCKNLDSFPAFRVIPHLESLEINGWPKLKSLPEQIYRFSCLSELILGWFKALEALPDSLGDLVSLEELTIMSCSNLVSLPSHEAILRLHKLKLIEIIKCPLLEERCKEEIGEEWHKIRHVPSIYIDGRVIEN